MRLYDQQSGDDLRFALNNPDLLSPADIAKRDSMAERFNTSYGMADAGFDDLSQEARIADARKVQADAWVKEAPENAAFLAEDGEKLMAVYDSLVDNGLLDEQDMQRDFAQDVADSGSGWGDTIEIARLNTEVVELGQSFLNGTQGDMETFRSKVADVYGKLNAYRARRKDPTGFYGFVEQMYRMGTEDVPHVLSRVAESAPYGAAAGAVVGTVMGSAVPFIGNLTGAVGGSVAGALAGAKAGAVRGMYEAAQRGEEANFAVQMLMQKDDAGNFLDENTVREMARLYGMGSAAIETTSDLVTAKILSPVLKTVGAKMGGLPAKLVAKDAMKSAIQHQSIKPVLLGVAKSMGAGALAEGTEEAVQEGLSSQVEAWAKNWLNDQGKNYFHDVEQGLWGSETWGDMARAGFEGAKVGLWFHVLPGVTKLYLDSQDVARARSFADKHKAVAQKVAESETAQLSPSRMETFLQSKGLNQTVLIPADAAWQMQQEGVDIVGAFGWRTETLEEAAAMGQDVAVSAARLHARFHSQPEVMNTLCDIMREKPNSMNALEAMDEGILADDVDAINEAMEEWQFSQNMMDAEMERLRSILKPAVLSIPELRRQILGVVDADTSVSSYIDAILAQIAGNAQYIAAHGGDGAGYISGLKIQGLVDALEGYGVGKVSPEERMAQEEMAAQAEADRPFWDNVWGMLDADSLKRDFPEARQELAKLHGRGLFAKKGEGVAVDELADMLKNAGWLEQDADSSTLVEMLKSKKRPKGRKAGAVLHQDIVSAEQKLAEDVAEWESLLDGLKNKPSNHQRMMSQTPLIMHLLGAEFREVYADPHVFDGMFPGESKSWQNEHENMTKEMLKQLPTALTDPIAVFESPTGNLAFMLDLVDNNGATVLAYVEFEAEHTRRKVNIVRTVFAKENEGVPNPQWFGKQYRNSLRYINNEKKRRWNATSGANSLWGKTSNASKKKILTEADLVKLKEQNPALYQFLGERGASALDAADEASFRMDNLAVAREMEEAGKDAAAIKMATGWERGADGLWRYEISDTAANVRLDDVRRSSLEEMLTTLEDAVVLKSMGYAEGKDSDVFAATFEERFGRRPVGEAFDYAEDDTVSDLMRELDNAKTGELPRHIVATLGEILEHHDLFSAYPQLADVEISTRLEDRLGNYYGYYSAQNNLIWLNPDILDDVEQLRNTILHEVQHAIQRMEGFDMSVLPAGSKYSDYIRLASENEAFNTGRRMGMTYEERLASLASSTEDVARKDQIFIRDGLSAFAALEQRAWHGTPHNFDAFTLQAIGSGEGAQAHGWGLYFAEDQDVSERYRQVLLSGQRTSALSPYMWFDEVREYVDGNASLDDTVRALKEFIQEVEQEDLSLLEVDEAEVYAQELEAARESLRIIEESPSPDEEFVNKQRGQLFEVEIPDNDVLLDEQKPFEDQPPLVRGALRKMVETLTDELMEDFGQDVHRIGRKKAAANIIKLFDGIDGRKIYSTLVGVFGSPREASEALNSVGIKGITYDGRSDGRCFVVFDDKAVDVLNTFYQRGERVPGQPMDSALTYGMRAAATYGRMPMGEPRAQVSFDPAAEGKAVIDFFKAADPTSAPHELYHIFRRELASTAMGEGASEKSKRMWKEACDFVGAKEGQPWTRAQEEKFAQAGERFLMEGVAPRPELQGLFERLKQWFLEVYTSVEAAGFEISDGMRKVFGDMLALSPEESDAMFRYGFGRMMEQSPADGIDTSVVKPMDDSAAAADVLTALQADSEARLNESFARLNPDSDAARELQREFKESMGTADAELEKIQLEAEILREAALCDLRR